MYATAQSFPSLLHGLDAQRIAATSLAIALHAAVALVLFMPVQQPAVAIADEPALSLFVIPKVIHDPPLPPPKNAAITKPVPQAPPTAIVPDAPDVPAPPVPDGILPYVPPGDIVIAPPSAPSFVEIAADVAPAPSYPSMALRLRQEGRVLLRVLVDEQGRPTQVTIEQSSGVRLLDDTALKIVQARWHFVPARRDGVAISAYALVPIVFKINS